MRRTTQIDSPLAKVNDDNAAMMDFVRVLVEIAVAEYTAEQLFAEDALNVCLRLVRVKNRGLYEFGGDPWPEGRLAEAARIHLHELRAAKRN
jgi:hypothetical protein